MNHLVNSKDYPYASDWQVLRVTVAAVTETGSLTLGATRTVSVGLAAAASCNWHAPSAEPGPRTRIPAGRRESTGYLTLTRKNWRGPEGFTAYGEFAPTMSL